MNLDALSNGPRMNSWLRNPEEIAAGMHSASYISQIKLRRSKSLPSSGQPGASDKQAAQTTRTIPRLSIMAELRSQFYVKQLALHP